MPQSDLKRKTAAAGATDEDGFTKVGKRKQRKLDRHRPQFHYDTTYFNRSKKVGIAVGVGFSKLILAYPRLDVVSRGRPPAAWMVGG